MTFEEGEIVMVDLRKSGKGLKRRLNKDTAYGTFVKRHSKQDKSKVDFLETVPTKVINSGGGKSDWWVNDESISPRPHCYRHETPNVYHDKRDEYFCPFCEDE